MKRVRSVSPVKRNDLNDFYDYPRAVDKAEEAEAWAPLFLSSSGMRSPCRGKAQVRPAAERKGVTARPGERRFAEPGRAAETVRGLQEGGIRFDLAPDSASGRQAGQLRTTKDRVNRPKGRLEQRRARGSAIASPSEAGEAPKRLSGPPVLCDAMAPDHT